MTKKSSQKEDYFQAGKDWYVDRMESAKIQANRWFVAFLTTSILVVALAISVMTLFPLKTIIPVVVHQNATTGEFWVDRPTTPYVPENDAETQADIVRYLTARESYSAADINHRFHQVLLLSNSEISKRYEVEQANDNKEAPVNVLSSQGSRTVRIEDIVFIDKAGSQELRHFHQAAENLAKVDFTTTTIDQTGQKKTDAYVATIGWQYRGLPQNQADAWDNWNGFTVTTYRVDPRNINSNPN